MKDEIKEILDYLAFLEDIDTQKKVKQVADYITTLQEENERLRSYMKRAKDRLIEIENKYGYILDDVVYLLMRGSDKE